MRDKSKKLHLLACYDGVATKKSPTSRRTMGLKFVAKQHQRDSNTVRKPLFKPMQMYSRTTAVTRQM